MKRDSLIVIVSLAVVAAVVLFRPPWRDEYRGAKTGTETVAEETSSTETPSESATVEPTESEPAEQNILRRPGTTEDGGENILQRPGSEEEDILQRPEPRTRTRR